MTRKLIYALMSGWMINPLALIFAQFMGFANRPEIRVALLVSAAITPMQFLINDVITPISIIRKARLDGMAQALLGVTQVVCLLAVYLFQAEQTLQPGEMLAALASSGLTIWLSKQVATKFFSGLLAGRITSREAALVGLIPGLSVLFLYFYFAALQKFGLITGGTVLLLQIALPSVLQWAYCQLRHHRWNIDQNLSSIHIPLQAQSLVVIIVLCWLSLGLRDEISRGSTVYTSLTLLMLNSLFSVVMVVARSAFLQQKSDAVSEYKGRSKAQSIVLFASVITSMLVWMATKSFPLRGLWVQVSIFVCYVTILGALARSLIEVRNGINKRLKPECGTTK